MNPCQEDSIERSVQSSVQSSVQPDRYETHVVSEGVNVLRRTVHKTMAHAIAEWADLVKDLWVSETAVLKQDGGVVLSFGYTTSGTPVLSANPKAD